MTQEKPKTYTAEFRESAVKLATESDKPVAQTARDLGINENTLHTWIGKYTRPLETDKSVRTDDHLYEELKRLKKENARLMEERDLLKKAAGDSTGHCNTAEIFCDGDKKFNVFLGRPFNSSAILSSCSCEYTDRSVFLGIY
jgi:transposase